MARVVCPNCKTEFDVINGNIPAGHLNDCTDRIIGELRPAKINNENIKETGMEKKVMTGDELLEMMKGMSAEDMVKFVNDRFCEVKVTDDSFVRNSDYDLQHITAQTFRLLTFKGGRCWKDWNGRVVYSRSGWLDGFRQNYTYEYVMKFLATITKRMATLQRENAKMFKVELNFFDVHAICETLKTYKGLLEEHFKNLPRKKCGKEEYVHVGSHHAYDRRRPDDRPGMLFVKNIEDVYIKPIDALVAQVERLDDYGKIHGLVRNYISSPVYIPLRTDPTTCSAFVNAYMGRGAFFSMQNLVRHSGLRLYRCKSDDRLNKFDSLKLLDEMLEEHHGKYYKLMGLLKDSVYKDKFDFYEKMKEKYGD